MEKKTIGNFISVLRRAHGMTQKELGEKLFVSDKTVSRWERDECTPDLSLIPVIADLFGVTADELLRGERKTETEAEFQKSEKGSVKSEKQYRYLLQKRATDFKNLLFISVSLACLGLVAAMVCNLGFLQATLGFGLGAIFWIAGAVCLICSFNHYYLRVEEEGERTENFYFNAHMIYLSKNTVYIFLAVLGILLPLLFIPAYMGLTAPWWLLFGGLSALLLLLTVSFIYEFFIKIQWMKKGYLIYDESAVLLRNGRMKLIKRLSLMK